MGDQSFSLTPTNEHIRVTIYSDLLCFCMSGLQFSSNSIVHDQLKGRLVYFCTHVLTLIFFLVSASGRLRALRSRDTLAFAAQSADLTLEVFFDNTTSARSLHMGRRHAVCSGVFVFP